MFKDLTKVQISKTDHVHLAIKISENHVHNLTFTLESFVKAIKGSRKIPQFYFDRII